MTEFHAGQFDIAVIGAGHAGIEAALAAARLGMRTICFTINLYYNVNYTVTGEENEAVTMFLGATDPWVIVGMTAAIVVLCFVGSVVGMIISRELKKAGVLKK